MAEFTVIPYKQSKGVSFFKQDPDFLGDYLFCSTAQWGEERHPWNDMDIYQAIDYLEGVPFSLERVWLSDFHVEEHGFRQVMEAIRQLKSVKHISVDGRGDGNDQYCRCDILANIFPPRSLETITFYQEADDIAKESLANLCKLVTQRLVLRPVFDREDDGVVLNVHDKHGIIDFYDYASYNGNFAEAVDKAGIFTTITVRSGIINVRDDMSNRYLDDWKCMEPLLNSTKIEKIDIICIVPCLMEKTVSEPINLDSEFLEALEKSTALTDLTIKCDICPRFALIEDLLDEDLVMISFRPNVKARIDAILFRNKQNKCLAMAEDFTRSERGSCAQDWIDILVSFHQYAPVKAEEEPDPTLSAVYHVVRMKCVEHLGIFKKELAYEALAARDETIANLRKQLAASYETIANLRKELAARDETIAASHETVAASHETVANLRKELAARYETASANLRTETAAKDETAFANLHGEVVNQQATVHLQLGLGFGIYVLLALFFGFCTLYLME